MIPRALVLSILIALACCTFAGAAVITDSDNRTLAFDRPFTRIISLYPAHTRNLLDLGLDKEIIAVSRSDDQAGDRARTHFRDDPERLIALRPDLVLIRPMISRSYPQWVERLRQSNIQVVSLQPADMGQLLDYWQTLGKLTGREQAAADLIRSFGRRLAELNRRIAHIPQSMRKKVYFEAIHKRMKTFAPGSMAMFALQTGGGINAADDALQVRSTNIAAYSKERILAKAEEIDVFIAQQGRMNPVTLETILQEPGFSIIKAVRENQVFLIDEKLVSRPTMGLLDAAEAIMHMLYPELIRKEESS